LKLNLRPEEILQEFNTILEVHLEKIVSGESEVFLEIHEIADMMHIHPTHLSNSIKLKSGKSPCDICNEKTVKLAMDLLIRRELTIAKVANLLTFEATNFTKYFKRHTGITPSEYRKLKNLN